MGTPAPDAVKRLVDRFDQDRKVFLSGDYKEEQLRALCMTARRSALVVRTFSSPFFSALGRDMDNTLDTIRVRNWEVSLFFPFSPFSGAVSREP
jgi:hypothetical protein